MAEQALQADRKRKSTQQVRAAKPIQQGPIVQESADLLALQRVMHNPVRAAPGDILGLQRAAGNRAVSRLIQAKLTVGGSGDRYEQEADRVAEQVMSCQQPATGSQPQAVQRQEEEEEIQTKPFVQRRSDGSFNATPEMESRLAAGQGNGQPLPGGVRSFMEDRFGADFSGVRVHTDPAAAGLSHQIQAQAFTYGNDIYLGTGRYEPGTGAGKRLLAHELTHVVQQNHTKVQKKPDGGLPAISSARRGRIQRLSFQNTQWENATKAWASYGGAKGVLFVTDDSADAPVVVKSGEVIAPELTMAANLTKKLWKPERTAAEGGDRTEWEIETPGARMLEDGEAARIQASLPDKVIVPPRPPMPKSWTESRIIDRASGLINTVDKADTVVFTATGGTDFKDIIKAKHTRKRTFRRWKRTERGSLPLQNLMTNDAYLRALGKMVAFDIFTMNTDRLHGELNAENWKVDVDAQKINLIDNISQNPGFAFRKFLEKGGFGNKQRTLDWQVNMWKADNITVQLKNGDFQGLAELAWTKLSTKIINQVARPQDRAYMNKMLPPLKANVVNQIAQGIQTGKTRLLGLDPASAGLVAGLPANIATEVQESMQKRLAFLGS